MCVHVCDVRICAFVYVCVGLCVDMYVCIYARVCVWRMCTCVWMCVCVCVRAARVCTVAALSQHSHLW